MPSGRTGFPAAQWLIQGQHPWGLTSWQCACARWVSVRVSLAPRQAGRPAVPSLSSHRGVGEARPRHSFACVPEGLLRPDDDDDDARAPPRSLGRHF